MVEFRNVRADKSDMRPTKVSVAIAPINHRVSRGELRNVMSAVFREIKFQSRSISCSYPFIWLHYPLARSAFRYFHIIKKLDLAPALSAAPSVQCPLQNAFLS